MGEQGVSIGPTTRTFTVPRDCEVTVVPAGHRTTLPAGAKVTLLQALGANATVTTVDGEMVRLSPADSVEFGFLEAPTERGSTGDAAFDVADVWAAAATVYDPEIPVDVVELGLIYRVEAHELAGGGQRVEVDMSVTAHRSAAWATSCARTSTTPSLRSPPSTRSRWTWCSTRPGTRRGCPTSPASSSG